MAGDETSICWSKNSQALYFKENRKGILRYDLTTGRTTTVLTEREHREYQFLDVSPDDTQLLCSHDGGYGTWNIATRQYTPLQIDRKNDLGQEQWMIRWLPTNELLLFVGDAGGSKQIRLIDPNLHMAKTLPPKIHGVYPPYPAADGSGLGYYHDEDRVSYYNFAQNREITFLHKKELKEKVFYWKYLSQRYAVYELVGIFDTDGHGETMLTDLSTLKTRPFNLPTKRVYQELLPDMTKYYAVEDDFDSSKMVHDKPIYIHIADTPGESLKER